MSRFARTWAPIAALAVIAALPAAAPGSAGSGPTARASARKCHLSYREQSGGLGTTYVLSLRVRGTSCRNGKRVVKGFHKCRPGRAGRCRRRVFGYKCSEKRFDKSSFSYMSKVRCAKGGRRVWHTYQQNI